MKQQCEICMTKIKVKSSMNIQRYTIMEDFQNGHQQINAQDKKK